MASAEEAKALFIGCGLDPKTAADITCNAKVSAALREVIAEAGVAAGCDKAVGNLLYATATKARGGRCRGTRVTRAMRRRGGRRALRGACADVRF
jgi:hypothetical protein